MKTKIFLASSPIHPNNNLLEFYSNLRSDDNIDLLHSTTLEEMSEEELNGVQIIEYELAKRDKLKILESSFVILDWDSGIKSAYLYWSCINPNSKTVIVSKTFPDVDLYASEKVVAIVKPELLLSTMYSLISVNQEAVSPDKQDQAHD